jgi:C-8 sterol isomerase
MTMGYIFDPDTIHQISKKGIGLPFEQQNAAILAGLAEAYPGHIETNQEWIFNLSGGMTGIMTVAHASLSEYLLIYGTPIGSEGYSGSYHIDIWDAVVAGEMNTYLDETPGVAEHTPPGVMAYLPKGKTKACHFSPNCWMLEYGRGPILSALPMGLGDGILRGLDPWLILKTIRIYTRLTVKELLQGKI